MAAVLETSWTIYRNSTRSGCQMPGRRNQMNCLVPDITDSEPKSCISNTSVRMKRSKYHKVLFIVCSMLGLSSGYPSTPHIPEEHVSSSLHGSVTLHSMFLFAQSLEGLTVIWDKEVENRKPIVYWILKGEENLEEQDPRYRGRVELFAEFPQGHLDLILRNVTYEDEGTYYCRAANNKGHGYKTVTLSIDSLETEDSTATLVTIDGMQRWKCRGSGDYHNPEVQWITTAGKDLSSYGRLSVTDQSDGRKLVESILDYDVKANVQVSCRIMEGRSAENMKQVNIRAAEDKEGTFSNDDNEEKKESPYRVLISSAVIGTLTIIIILIGLVLLLRRKEPPPDDTTINHDLLKLKDSNISKDNNAVMRDKLSVSLMEYGSTTCDS